MGGGERWEVGRGGGEGGGRGRNLFPNSYLHTYKIKREEPIH